MNAANTMSASTRTAAEGSFELIEATCTAERMPLATMKAHTMATSAVAHPHRNAVEAFGFATPRAASAP